MRQPEHFPASRELPDTTFWYVLDDRGYPCARIPPCRYAAALGIATRMLPEEKAPQVMLYGSLPPLVRKQAVEQPILSAWGAVQLTSGGGAS